MTGVSIVALCGIAPAQPERDSVRPGVPITVHCHFADEKFADEARRVVDLTWRIAVRHLSPPADAREQKIVVHVYRDSASYARAGLAEKTDVFRKFPGFASSETMMAHVLPGHFGSAEWSSESRNAIAHETMHLSMFAALPCSPVWHPAWLTEGMAQWAEGEVAIQGGWVESRTQDHQAGGMIMAARAQIDEGVLPTVAGMLRNDYGSLGKKDHYPSQHALFVMLMERYPEAMEQVLATARSAKSSPAFAQRLADELERAIGEQAWASIEDEFVDFIRKREVTTGLPDGVDMRSDAVGKPGEPGFIPATPGVRWLDENKKAAFTLTANVTIRDEGARQADIVFARTDNRWLRASFLPGAGVYISERQVEQGQPAGWTVLGTGPATLAFDQTHAIKLRAWRRKLKVYVDGKQVAEAKFAAPALTGRWGAGAPLGSRASWKSLRLR